MTPTGSTTTPTIARTSGGSRTSCAHPTTPCGPSVVRSDRPGGVDVLIQPEDVGRVVLPLELDEPVPAVPQRGPYEVRFVAEPGEVEVRLAGAERCHRL